MTRRKHKYIKATMPTVITMLALLGVAIILPASSYAVPDSSSRPATHATTSSSSSSTSSGCSTTGNCADCSKGAKDCLDCTNGKCNDPAADPNVDCNLSGCDFIKKYVNPGINLFSVIFGLIAAISLIIGGINFATSEDDPQKVSRAKNRISKTVIALVAYFFLYAFLQFLVPGGIF